MKNLPQIFCENLHQKLSEKIWAGFWIRIIEDELVVKIVREGEVDAEIHVGDMTSKFLTGYSTDYACNEIVSQYRRIILSRYFKKENKERIS